MSVALKTINPEEVFNFLLTCPDNTRMYLGADSERHRDKNGRWYATYYLVCVIHIGSHKGCRIFAEKSVEADFTQNAAKPTVRLTTEAYKLADLYNRLKDVIDATRIPVNIHLDISVNEQHGSYSAGSAAAGYIMAMCGVEATLKPHAWAASYAADRGGDFI